MVEVDRVHALSDERVAKVEIVGQEEESVPCQRVMAASVSPRRRKQFSFTTIRLSS
jgi:hypothetical protein